MRGAARRLWRWEPLRPVMRRWWPRAAILVYHRVGDATLDPAGQLVAPGRFEAQLQALRERYTIVSLPELVATQRTRRYVDGTVAITFDDGYVDNLTLAQPIAQRLGVPLTVFVTLTPIMDGQPFWWDELARLLLGAVKPPDSVVLDLPDGRTLGTTTFAERLTAYRELHPIMKRQEPSARRQLLDMLRAWAGELQDDGDSGRPMTVDELRTLSRRPGITLGTHTLTHPMLSVLDSASQRHELVRSRQQLASLTGYPVTLMAYPYGKHADLNRHTASVARTAGYEAACTTTGTWIGPWSDPYRLPRITVHDWSAEQLLARLDAVFRSAS